MSKKYISVETAVALAMQYCPDDDGVCSKAGHDLRELLDDLENADPADVQPVVTCEECWHHVDCGYHYCNAWGAPCPDDAEFYCKYGIREGPRSHGGA